jgi:hypothetical protein
VVFQRAATVPTTPSASSDTPSTWYAATQDVPYSSAPLWSSYGERAAGGTNFVWQTPVRSEAISAVTTGQQVALGLTTSSTMSWSLAPGQSRIVYGQTAFDAPTGNGNAYVQIETREQGGSWTASNGTSETYASGEPVAPEHNVTITNSSAQLVIYEARATVIRSNGNSGAITTSRSAVSI